jgi:cell fate regulator YaaT (PSP1 superfamily)
MNEYLVSHGCTGEFGRFRAAATAAFRRGARVVVRSQRGLELGEVLCLCTPRHAQSMPDSFVGELLRAATPEDEQIAAGLGQRTQQLFDDGRRLALDLKLPLEIFDVEVSLDGHQVTLFYVRWQECDERPLVRALSQKYEAMVALHDLGLPVGATGCGRPDCGQQAGGCTTCSTGGSCASCGKTMGKDVQEYFAGLRQKMEERRRVSLA